MQDIDVHIDCTKTKKNSMQWVVTPDGWISPLHIRSGLAYMDMRPPMKDEYETYNHVVLTSDVTWDPTVLDNETDLGVHNNNLIVDIDEEYYDARSSDIGKKVPNALLRKCSGTIMNVTHHCHLNVLNHEDTLDFLASEKYFDANEHETKRMEPDYENVQACLASLL